MPMRQGSTAASMSRALRESPFARPQTERCPSQVSCPARAAPSRSSSRAMPSPSHTSARSPSRRARRSPRVTPSAWPGRVATPNGRRPTSISASASRREPTGTSIRRRSCRRGSPLRRRRARPLPPTAPPHPLRLRSRRRPPPRVPPRLPRSPPAPLPVSSPSTSSPSASAAPAPVASPLPPVGPRRLPPRRPRRPPSRPPLQPAAAEPVVASAGTASAPAPLPATSAVPQGSSVPAARGGESRGVPHVSSRRLVASPVTGAAGGPYSASGRVTRTEARTDVSLQSRRVVAPATAAATEVRRRAVRSSLASAAETPASTSPPDTAPVDPVSRAARQAARLVACSGRSRAGDRVGSSRHRLSVRGPGARLGRGHGVAAAAGGPARRDPRRRGVAAGAPP